MSISQKRLIFFILSFLPSLIYALDGNAIKKNAETYRDCEWKCNTWNARSENVDSKDFEQNNNYYPFFPLGAAISEDENGEIVFKIN
ncbi:MAG TPA: hypothetical protein PLB12_03265 [Candidatus Goldiibacteriota bacterium]|nr:hypothetical protein [Candidatus Goldiibacteriota bacterium]HPN64940.1 hypothetical protein [Candidatus Goldiibacteriota bacterium]HRQ43349.1 hypothetical protein [Candidatus Goldiibacteriota bacterium]